jgi:outer membrane protein OmpA-like peptidoglycan-associated protein
MKRSLLKFIAVSLAAASLWGCSASNTVKGGAIGAGAGAILGGVIGNQVGNHTAIGAIIGAAVGGTAGALIGHYMDKQAEEIQNDIKDAKVERVGEGIKITFNSGILFAVNASTLTSQAQSNISELSKILIKYKDTNILIEGHTDSDGTTEYNQTLSERRANSVQFYLASQGVENSRIIAHGYGETQPLVPNDTQADKAKNRRVEVAIMANDDLKKAAENNQVNP